MRNLKLVSHFETDLTVKVDENDYNRKKPRHTFLSIDFDAGLVFVADRRFVVAIGSDLAVQWKVELKLTNDADEVVGIHWSLENEALVVATSAGDLLLVKAPSPLPSAASVILVDDYEEVGAISSGCRALAASPDEELLLLVTGDSTFVLMTSAEFEPVAEEPYAEESVAGSETFVNVGWGKKETQFHGSAGKAAALASKLPNKAELSLHDDGITRVCWRSDGQQFAISYVQMGGGGGDSSAGNAMEGGRRRIKIFARDGTLISISEDVAGLEHALHWRPSGNLMASSVRRPNKHEVAFFEPNGLRHGEFTLPFNQNQVEVQSLCWNPNSDILVIALEEIAASNDAAEETTVAQFLQLWTCGNYHWYLKQTLLLRRRKLYDIPMSSTAMMWDPLAPNKLHVVQGGGRYHTFEWSFVVTRSNSLSTADLSQVSVIDGDVVKVTPFRLLHVPPPMSAYELKLPFFVNALSSAPRTTPDADAVPVNAIAALTSNLHHAQAGIFHLFIFSTSLHPPLTVDAKPRNGGCGGFNSRATPLELRRKLIIETEEEESKIVKFPSHLTWVDAGAFLFVTQGRHIWRLDFSGILTGNSTTSEGEVVKPRLLHSSSSPHFIHSISPLDSSVAIIQFSDGRFQTFNFRSSCSESAFSPLHDHRHLPADEVVVASFAEDEDSSVVVSLSSRGALVAAGEIKLSDAATSMAMHRDFLLYTTTRHELVALRTATTSLARFAQIVADKGATGDTTERRFLRAGVAVSRPVERGARIVTCVSTETAVVLQMPRGNLETIHPRALLLSCVQRHLRAERFLDAVHLMRRHRLNMNLLHDFDPRIFFEKIEMFVAQVDDAQLFNLFLTDLEEADVCDTMYKDYFNATAEQRQQRDSRGVETVISSSTTATTKVNAICDAMVVALKKTTTNSSSPRFLTSILTALGKKSPPEISTALRELRQVQAVDEKLADESLKYLVSLVDVNELFDEALGTYDLRTVVMVAEKSQKDPKEYLPFLNSLNAMDPHFRHYTIDVRLKRWEKALHHIQRCGSDYFESHLLPLVETHVLYSEALKFYDQRKDVNYRIISAKFGAFLGRKRRYEEAGVVLSRVGEYEAAMRAFQHALDWRQMVCMAAYLKLGPAELTAIARETAESLKAVDRAIDASTLFEQYAGDVEEAVTTLIEGRQWDEALRMMHKHGRIDFIESDFKDAIVTSAAEQLAAIEALRGEFVRHAERLQVVRREKVEAAKREAAEEDDGLFGGRKDNYGGCGGDDDLYSDVSSVSGVSAQSSRTTRSNASSSFTKISGRAGKAKKKQDKKMHSLKEGGAFEHLALVEALHTILLNLEKLKPEVDHLLKVLAQFFYDDESEKLATTLTDFESVIEKYVKVIWPPTTTPTDSTTDEAILSTAASSFDRLQLGPNATANSIALSYASSTTTNPDRMDFHLLAPHLQHPPTSTGIGKDETFRLDILTSASRAIVHRSKTND